MKESRHTFVTLKDALYNINTIIPFNAINYSCHCDTIVSLCCPTQGHTVQCMYSISHTLMVSMISQILCTSNNTGKRSLWCRPWINPALFWSLPKCTSVLINHKGNSLDPNKEDEGGWKPSEKKAKSKLPHITLNTSILFVTPSSTMDVPSVWKSMQPIAFNAVISRL